MPPLTQQPQSAAECGTPAAPPAAERYRGSFELPRFPLGDGQELVYSPVTRAAQVLPAISARLLQGCHAFATLDDHAVSLGREFNFSPLQIPELHRHLAELVQAGFLVPQSELLASCRSQPGSSAARIATLAVPTRNRTSSLARCLDSYIENSRRHERRLACVVVDDSPDGSVRQDNRQMLEGLKVRHGAAIAYAGPEEKVRFAEALVHATGLAPEDVRFGLLNEEGFAVATGASRNALLLHAVGDALLQVDDDTV